jgi:hypothetical protein
VYAKLISVEYLPRKVATSLATTGSRVGDDVQAKGAAANDVAANDVAANDTGAKDVAANGAGAKDMGTKDTGAKDAGAKDVADTVVVADARLSIPEATRFRVEALATGCFVLAPDAALRGIASSIKASGIMHRRERGGGMRRRTGHGIMVCL